MIVVAAFSCTGLGLINAALSLRVRENAVLSNVIFGFLLIFTGANIPLSELPDWAQTISDGLPFTHAIEAARELADGASLGSVAGLVGTELLVGVLYAALGYALLRYMEVSEPPLRHAGTLVTEKPAAVGGGVAPEREAADALAVRRLPRDRLAHLLRDRRLLHVPGRRQTRTRSSTRRSAPP